MITVIENFISPQEEEEILKHLKPSRVVTGFGRNRVYRYGSSLPYKGKTELIPTWLAEFCIKVADQWRSMGIHPNLPDHVTINEYHPKQSIDWHVDSASSGSIITVLSIESDAVMGIKEPAKTYILPRRSLLHMTEEDRWDKQHCIHPVTSHRWSLVFRKGT